MRIAIPIWEDKISPVLDTASRLMIVEVVNGKESSRFEIYLDEEDLSRRSLRIRGVGVDILICGAVSRPFLRMLRANGIQIIPEIAGRADEVLGAYFEGTPLNSGFLMPGNRRNGSRCRRDSGPGRPDRGCRSGLKTDRKSQIKRR